MLRKIGLAAALIVAGAAPAMAEAVCTAPAAPASIDASKATGAQVRAALAAAQDFMAQSDNYQNCLAKDLDTQKASATKDAPFDPAFEKDIDAKMEANRSVRQQVADSASNAISAFKSAHACDGKPLESCK